MNRFDLGSHVKEISTTSEHAQSWFNQGLKWCYAFNFEEGIKCFRRALETDPQCVMAHWGVAYGAGPFYNLVWREQGEQERARFTRLAFDHLAQALALSEFASELENDLVNALSRRIQKPHSVPLEEFDRWDSDYADQMRRVHYKYPDDIDVAALFVEALITRTPRRLWNLATGKPEPGSDVLEALRVCERAMAEADAQDSRHHPAILHLHIHIMEMSKMPEWSMEAADTLSTLCPDAGHLAHMPAHIYVLCGRYDLAKTASEKAIAADDKYVEYAGDLNFYTAARCHDLHLMGFTCMLLGQYNASLQAAKKLRSTITRELLSLADRPKLVMTLEAYHSMKMHVMVRFGCWQKIVEEPLPDDPEMYPVTTAMHHYARAIAFAFLNRIAEADKECDKFHYSIARLPEGRRFANNSAHDVLAVGAKMMEGEVAYHKGNHDMAFKLLRESVELDDNLAYHEPWAWMHPPRHALGALLLEQGQHSEAEQIYRDDLGLSGRIQRCAQHPDNVWALHGLVECLSKRDSFGEIDRFKLKLADALEHTDVPIASSCMCRKETFKSCGYLN